MTERACQLQRPVAAITGVVRYSKGSVVPRFVPATEAETDWSGLMIRVRDGQDKTAFAMLFRHFAPRIKAFLMKSGANAALAEECAQDVMATLWQKSHLFDPRRASVAIRLRITRFLRNN